MSGITTCNKCGKELDFWDEMNEFNIYRSLGYGTVYDGMTLKLNLCCKCMDELIETCKISPLIDNSHTI